MPKVTGKPQVDKQAAKSGESAGDSLDSFIRHSTFGRLVQKLVDYKGEGGYLPIALSAAVPLWQLEFAELSNERRQEKLAEASKDDLCLRLEYVLHQGPKPGDSARAFNDLAQAIALLSFCPGGVTAFGMHFESTHKQRRP